MKERFVVLIREIILGITFAISTALSVRLFIDRFATQQGWSIAIYVILAIVLQCFQLYSLMIAKTCFREKKLAKGIGFLALYSIVTIISLVASFSWIESCISQNSTVAEASNQVFENYDMRVDSIDRQIARLEGLLDDKTNDAKELDPMFVSAGDLIVNTSITGDTQLDIDALYERRQAIIDERNTNTTVSVVASDSFTLLASRFGVESEGIGNILSFLFMAFVAIIIELCVAVTSQPMYTNVKITENKAKLTKYVNSLMEINGVRLNSDKKIAEETGLTLNECKRYKEKLQEWTFNGIPLVRTGKGGSRANFTKDQILRFVNLKTKLG